MESNKSLDKFATLDEVIIDVKPSDSQIYQMIRVPISMIPDGAKLVECYMFKDTIIVIGEPAGDHNCDQMGCSSLSHVIHRFSIKSI